MKPLRRLIGDLMGWRWAPAVGLCVASLFYVLVVVALVPEEIGVPTTNARFAQKPTATPTEPELPTFPTAMPEAEATPPPPAAVRPAAVVDFGRRGFSPPLERPEAPPAPVPPPPVAAPVVPAPAPVAAAPQPPGIPPPQPGSAGAAEAAAQAAGTPDTPPSAPQTPTVTGNPFSRTIQALRGGKFPGAVPAPSAAPEPPAAPPTPPPNP